MIKLSNNKIFVIFLWLLGYVWLLGLGMCLFHQSLNTWLIVKHPYRVKNITNKFPLNIMIL